MSPCKISIIIPACDREKYILEALDCAICQTIPAYEIIIVDNGNSALSIPKEYADRVNILRIKPYSGVATARNRGVEIAGGQYIAFLDDDDLWEKGYLEKINECIEKEAPDLIIARLDKLEHGVITTDRNAEGQLTESILLTKNPGITGTSTTVQKSSFLALGGYDTRLRSGEDKALCIEMLRNNMKVMSLPHAQAIIREHAGDRLANDLKLADGIADFIAVYGESMSFVQRQYNLMKLWRYRAKNGQGAYAQVRYIYHKYLFEIVKTLPR